MKIYGMDFTSNPTRKKPITCLECHLDGTHLLAGPLTEWTNFEDFERGLCRPGPWIAGMDFPFGQARRFIETIGWPDSWEGYVTYSASLGKVGFETALEQYASGRPYGDKLHFRKTDRKTGSQSPQKLHFVPVAKMFFQGAPRLIEAGVTIPGLYQGDPERLVVEAYPGVLARYLIGKRSYKAESKKKQTAERSKARKDILKRLNSGELIEHYGLTVAAPDTLADDPAGDRLDALLCAIQAAWAWNMRTRKFGEPEDHDPLEGWIADPMPENRSD